MAIEQVTCLACGAIRDPEDTFCGSCGARLDGSGSDAGTPDPLSIEDLIAAVQHNTDSRTTDIALGVFYGMLLFSTAAAVVWFIFFMGMNGG